MSIFNNIWGSLKPSYMKAGTSMLGSIRPPLTFGGQEGQIKYVSRAGYRSVLEYVLRQETIAALQKKLHNMIHDALHAREMAAIEMNRQAQQAKQQWLIDLQQETQQDLGSIDIEGDGTLSQSVKAMTAYGTYVPEALLMAYEGDKVIPVVRTAISHQGMQYETINTKSIFFIDLAPTVSLDSQKNLVMTTVQGRDFSRKELISGGDYKFKISGNIVYDEPGIYPENDVKKFLNIMQHNGPIRVVHRMFKNLGVKAILVQDYSLDKQDMLNVQPYSFSCVAIEPDEELVVAKDTIGWYNAQIDWESNASWVDALMSDEMVESAIQDIASYGLAQLIDLIPSTRV